MLIKDVPKNPLIFNLDMLSHLCHVVHGLGVWVEGVVGRGVGFACCPEIRLLDQNMKVGIQVFSESSILSKSINFIVPCKVDIISRVHF